MLLLDVLNQAIAPAHRGEVLVAPVAALHRAGEDSGVVQVRLQHVGAGLVYLQLIVHVLGHALERLGLVGWPKAPGPLQRALRAASRLGYAHPMPEGVWAENLRDPGDARRAIIDNLANGPLLVRGLVPVAVAFRRRIRICGGRRRIGR